MQFRKRLLKAKPHRCMGAAGKWHGICELTSAVSRRPVGDQPRFGFFPANTRTFKRAVIQNAVAFSDVCNLFWWWWRQQVIRIIHFYELILKLKPVFLLFLYYISITRSSFACGQELFQLFKLLNIHYNLFEKLLPFIFQTFKLNAKFSFLFACSRHIMNPAFSFRGAVGGGGQACRVAALQTPPKLKKNRFSRYHDIDSFPWFLLQPNSTTEIGW
jgi:hypothetical protein